MLKMKNKKNIHEQCGSLKQLYQTIYLRNYSTAFVDRPGLSMAFGFVAQNMVMFVKLSEVTFLSLLFTLEVKLDFLNEIKKLHFVVLSACMLRIPL